jgi:hypothetical protein
MLPQEWLWPVHTPLMILKSLLHTLHARSSQKHGRCHQILFPTSFSLPLPFSPAPAGQQTVFTMIMGSISFKYFNINTWLPVLLIVHCALVALRVYEKMSQCCVAGRFKFTTDDVDDEFTEKARR